MSEFLVTYIRSAGASDTHVGISHLGGPQWSLAKTEVVDAIDSGEHTFYVLSRGRRIQLAVVSGAIDRYVRGRVDGMWTDDLLALPRQGWPDGREGVSAEALGQRAPLNSE